MIVWAFTSIFMACMLGLLATVVFDAVHWLLHKLMARPGLLGRIGAMHAAHHAFVDETLAKNLAWERANLRMHVVPEYVTQVIVVTALGLLLVPVFGWVPLGVVHVGLLGGFVGNYFHYRGYDFNHAYTGPLPRTLSMVWVTPSYHLLHHVYPKHFYASYVPILDVALGTCSPIAGRTFVVTGASGAFGAPLCEMLEARGGRVIRLKFGVDWTYDDVARADPALAQADVLVLAHGSKVKDAMAANCGSFVAFVERYKQLTLDRKLAPEVWALGSEIEGHPHFGVEELRIYSASKRAYAAHARRYLRDRSFCYRHIVPSAFTSPMGPGLMSGKFCARVALAFIQRGFRYVPVTYTGIALWNFLKASLLAPAPAPAGSVSRWPVRAPREDGAGVTTADASVPASS